MTPLPERVEVEPTLGVRLLILAPKTPQPSSTQKSTWQLNRVMLMLQVEHAEEMKSMGWEHGGMQTVPTLISSTFPPYLSA